MLSYMPCFFFISEKRKDCGVLLFSYLFRILQETLSQTMDSICASFICFLQVRIMGEKNTTINETQSCLKSVVYTFIMNDHKEYVYNFKSGA